jgi:hypothetical protein
MLAVAGAGYGIIGGIVLRLAEPSMATWQLLFRLELTVLHRPVASYARDWTPDLAVLCGESGYTFPEGCAAACITTSILAERT